MKAKKRLRKLGGKTPDQVQHLPALHPQRLGAYLPIAQAEWMAAERICEIADDVKRRGAGGIKAGLPLIMPAGRSAFKEFHEAFTKEPEKKPEKKQPTWEEIEKSAGKFEGPRSKVVALPINVCIWCLEGGKDPQQMEVGMLPITERIHRCELSPGDIFRYNICKPCKDAREAEYKTNLKVVVGKDVVPAASIKSMEHYNKLRKNIVHVLKSTRLERAEGGEDGWYARGIGAI